MRWLRRRPAGTGEAEHLIDRMTVNTQHGRFERSVSGLTAAAALITTAEVFIEHYKAGFGKRWMWSPILVTPPVVISGIAGVYSKRWAKTAPPITAGLTLEPFERPGAASEDAAATVAAHPEEFTR